jgi:hypothetical protein
MPASNTVMESMTRLEHGVLGNEQRARAPQQQDAATARRNLGLVATRRIDSSTIPSPWPHLSSSRFGAYVEVPRGRLSKTTRPPYICSPPLKSILSAVRKEGVFFSAYESAGIRGREDPPKREDRPRHKMSVEA